MASQNFLASLGAALSEGSRLAGRARQERRQEDLDKQERERKLLQMALQREQMDLSKQGFEAQQQDRARGFAKDLLEQAGPEGVLDPNAAQTVEGAGYGFRLGPQQEATLGVKAFTPDAYSADPNAVAQVESPGVQAGRPVLANFQQQNQLDEQAYKVQQREQQRRAQAALNSPGFYKMPDTQQQVVWQQAGLSGQIPMSVDEWKTRQDYEHQLRLGELRVQGDNAERAARVRGSFTGGGAGGRLPLGAIKELKQFDSALSQGGELMRMAQTPGATGVEAALSAWLPSGFSEATGIGIEAKQRQALVNLSRQLIGKALEGGVLRKEDEEKYKDILPTIQDPTPVATQKIQQLVDRLTEDRDIYIETLQNGGYRVGPRPGVTVDPNNRFNPGAQGGADPLGLGLPR